MKNGTHSAHPQGMQQHSGQDRNQHKGGNTARGQQNQQRGQQSQQNPQQNRQQGDGDVASRQPQQQDKNHKQK